MTSEPLPMPFGYCGRLRVEQDARRIDAARADDDDLRQHLRARRRSCDRSTARRLARPLSSTRMRAATAFDRISSRAGLQRERQQVIGGVEERRGVAAGAAGAAVVARRETRAVGLVMLARRPATIGDAERSPPPSAAAARRSAAPGGGCRNLLPGSESESSVPPQTPISCSTLS